MGADYYDRGPREAVPLGIGENSTIDHAIIDKNARIGNGVVITPHGKPSHMDGPNFYIRDGIVVIPKGAIIPHGTWI
jgi:glucose-1-phosphate adenylyltransferase